MRTSGGGRESRGDAWRHPYALGQRQEAGGGGASAGVAPRIMGFGPAPASKKLMARLGLTPADFDVIELNEAFASQGLATLRDLGIADDDPRVNPNGGAIALGHPLGMSGARITGKVIAKAWPPGPVG